MPEGLGRDKNTPNDEGGRALPNGSPSSPVSSSSESSSKIFGSLVEARSPSPSKSSWLLTKSSNALRSSESSSPVGGMLFSGTLAPLKLAYARQIAAVPHSIGHYGSDSPKNQYIHLIAFAGLRRIAQRRYNPLRLQNVIPKHSAP